MSGKKTVHGILEVIKSITSNRESGRLDVSSFGTHGTLLFSDGKLIDARLESLSGFQAVNAAVSLRNVEISFDHVAPVAHASTITPAEREVLLRFFGIETAEMEAPADKVEPNWNTTPEQVVPLTEVEEIPLTEEIPPVDLADPPTVEAEPPLLVGSTVGSTVGSSVRYPTGSPVTSIEDAREAFSRETAPPSFAFGFRPRVAVAIGLVLLVGLAVAATALRSKLKARQQAAVASVVASEPSVVPDEPRETKPTTEAKPTSEAKPTTEPTPVSKESPSVAVSQLKPPAQQNLPVQQNTAASARNVFSPPATVSAERRATTTDRDTNVRDLTGEWRVINTVEKTAYKSFDSMQVGFRLKINQRGKEFTARGEKFSENGQMLPAGSRTPIHLTGSINGDTVVATFIEEGRARRTNGRFVWKLQSGGDTLAGTFVTTAANSSGRSAVTKQ